jgi:hypothetical protein
MRRAAIYATFILLACSRRPEDAPASRAQAAVSPTADQGSVIDLTAGNAPTMTAPRELHPREDGDDSCVEMYSTCMPEKAGENCTSARFQLACGETARHPKGEFVKCVCP